MVSDRSSYHGSVLSEHSALSVEDVGRLVTHVARGVACSVIRRPDRASELRPTSTCETHQSFGGRLSRTQSRPLSRAIRVRCEEVQVHGALSSTWRSLRSVSTSASGPVVAEGRWDPSRPSSGLPTGASSSAWSRLADVSRAPCHATRRREACLIGKLPRKRSLRQARPSPRFRSASSA